MLPSGLMSTGRVGARLGLGAMPAVLVFACDWWSRGERLARFEGSDWVLYGQGLSLCACLWALLLVAGSMREASFAWRLGRSLCWGGSVLLFTACLGGQMYFFEQNHAYMNRSVASFATHFAESVLNQLLADLSNYFASASLAFFASVLLLFVSYRWMRPALWLGRVALLLSPVALYLAAFHIPTQSNRRQASPPDALYLEALGELAELQLGLSKNSGRARPTSRNVAPLPSLKSPIRPARNIVFVLLESVRKDATCNRFEPGCERTAATNELFPNRIPFEQLRALDSCTAVSMAVLWTGLGPHESREALHTWPLLFDYARESGYSTAYWTSQNLMFGNMRLWLKNLGVDHTFSALDVDPESDIDLGAPESAFADQALEHLSKLEEPYFLTIQLSNAHYPYLVDESGPQPFQPATTSKAPDKNDQFFNHYQNAVYQEDQHLARILGAIREAPGGENTVIVYTSDHGEAFREHHQMGHTFSVYDEEVLVPAWIDAPKGTLSDEERANLESHTDDFLFHPDLTSTLLDLMGVWRDPKIATYRKRMLGRSLLQEKLKKRAFPMTNCAAVWSCAFENWGYMRGSMKLEAREWDPDYHCFDLRLDPAESVNLGVDACGDLKDLANATFQRRPGQTE